MRAMYFEAFGAAPEIRTLPDPTPTNAGVVISVKATGLCRSDWHGWMGHDPDIRLPHVPGHELAGTISAVGRDVRRFKVGDRVTVPFVSGCGHCMECRSGNQQVCEEQFQPGFTHWGSFAEYVAIDYADQNLVHLPEEISYETAASLGCRFATSFRAVVDQGRLQGGEWLAVHGCGGVGLSAIMIGAALGANVVAIDIAEDKLALAKALGASVTIDSRSVADVSEAVRDVTGGGAHVSVDALGHPQTCCNSILNLRRRGRHVQVGLMLADHATPAIPMARVIAHELEIYGSHGMQSWRYDAMLRMILSGKLSPDRLIGRRITLSEAAPALATMDSFRENGISIIDRMV
ncbi:MULTISPECIES: zinc-dependent alcohol dehydrogenase family protein [Rhizobium/Agrobacterium group]|uniref:zinc-dependent alcohol dehydrogenase family protein n=1 Tax=Rhizobium/Agrobacterium group TaxID=227290 RepID=UPI0006B8FDAE|nr:MULTISPECIES: zinc-dependent alcohol dehydrogenase family protein [Rhizobium/Agrobacterium group]KPF51647.1 alcohol dehydrogenase [Rhizobium sp. AAP116]MDM7979969.1 zinc-dependent alcohol dehydrogenase family protein [Rhizobium sp.]MDM8012955.1 zinc-dependent alcohol dehydrogenase family protein [Rhizobium sp.]QGG90974.1 alcohol dehydrogenase catalytic domain-containing protein [Agrobacterium sp. MA01]